MIRPEESGRDEAPELTSGAKMLRLRHELARTDGILAIKWKDHEIKMASIEERKRQLEERKFEIKENYRKLNVYLQDVDLKRKQALERMTHIKTLRSQKEGDVIKLKEGLNQLREVRRSVKEKASRHSMFEAFLQEVASLEGKNEIADVIKMADTLTGERDNLLESIMRNQEDLKSLREEYVQYQQSKGDEILNLNLELFRLKDSTSKVKDGIVEAEKNFIRTSSCLDERIVKIDNIIRTADNIVQLVNNQISSSSSSSSSSSTNPEQHVNMTKAPANQKTTERFLKAAEVTRDMSDIIKDTSRKVGE